MEKVISTKHNGLPSALDKLQLTKKLHAITESVIGYAMKECANTFHTEHINKQSLAPFEARWVGEISIAKKANRLVNENSSARRNFYV